MNDENNGNRTRGESRDAGAMLLQQYLEQHSEPCPLCGYDLYRLTGRHCPECGQALRLRVGLEHPNLAAFITGLVGLAAGLGFSGMLLLYALYALVFMRSGPEWRDFALLLSQVAVSTALLVLWVRLGARVRRLPGTGRSTLALLCCALPFVNLAVFLWWVQ